MDNQALTLARKLAESQQVKEAQKAYLLALHQAQGDDPMGELEAATYLFFSKGGNRKTALTTMVSLYGRGHFQQEILDLMLQQVYAPDAVQQKERYESNCAQLSQYPYFFREDFPPFEDLPLLFFPFGKRGYLPFSKEKAQFLDYVDFEDPVIDRYFFKDLEKPILAQDVYSQYQLEYLHDNVRKSEWVARENHIYLHYTSWHKFCAHLPCLQMGKILREEKVVFLMEEEVEQYPIDFQERFGIDYSQYKVRPLEVREINKLIWHTQLSSHNGGDFFNEILDGHPNLLYWQSIMFDDIMEETDNMKKFCKDKNNQHIPIVKIINSLQNPTKKDYLVALFLYCRKGCQIDPGQRIVPALFFQPHFSNILFSIQETYGIAQWATLSSQQYGKIRSSSVFQRFKYIKTFTPLRRPTTSYGATNRFILQRVEKEKTAKTEKPKTMGQDLLSLKSTNQSFRISPNDRLYRDSRLVRFEDGKLNPKATFTALAEFLDIPYTESMTYCSQAENLNPESLEGNVRGFDLSTVYNTYEEYGSDEERIFLEFLFRDAYKAYGYDFLYYQEGLVDEAWLKENTKKFSFCNGYLEERWRSILESGLKIDTYGNNLLTESLQSFGEDIEENIQKVIMAYQKFHYELGKYFLKGVYFINEQGQPLHLMKKLELDPELLEQPLYH